MMQSRFFLHAFTSIVLALFFIMLGIATLIIPWSDTIRLLTIHFIEYNVWPWNLFGVGFLLIGFGLFAPLCLMRKRHYFTIYMGESHQATINESIIQEYLHTYWKQLCPSHEILCHLLIKKRNMQISVELPYFPQEQQATLIKKIELDLPEMMRYCIGYDNDIELSISFEKAPRKVDR